MSDLSTETIDRIRTSWALAAADAPRVANMFYAELFRSDPTTKPLFAGNLALQGRKLTQTLTFIVDTLDDLDTLLPAAVDLAKRHVGYGVEPAQYQSVGASLVKTLGQVLGPQFSEDDKQAWVTAYTILSGAMVSAAYET